MFRISFKKISLTLIALALGLTGFARADIRLPGNTYPLHYAIHIAPDVNTAAFSGSETIDFRVVRPTRTVVLNSLGLKISKAELVSPRALAASVKTDDNAEAATLTFPSTLSPGVYAVSLAWTGGLQVSPDGLFLIKYQDGGTEKRMVSTQFESVDARRMFPCWDEPAYKATFTLSADVPKAFTAVSNMPVKSETSVSADTKRVQFLQTPIMSSYLLVFVAGDLKYITGEADGVTIHVYARSGQEESGEFALHWAEKVLHYYDWYYGVKYPLPKLDLIAIPGSFDGAMENWGGIVFNESDILFDPKTSSQHTKEIDANTVAHEMAHQWTGDLVTMKWWDDLWLNEGFADWMADKVTDHFFPEWHIALRSIADSQEAMLTDALPTTHPIVRPIPDGRDADQFFDEITYNKGEAVIRMLENYLGEENFRKGIDRYMLLHKYGNATSDELWSALSSAAGNRRVNVSRIAHSWIDQPGFPKVMVSARCGKPGNSQIVSLSQARFTSLPTPASNEKWEIPLELAEGDRPATFLLTDPMTTDQGENSCGSPVAFLKQGFYRIQYQPALFAALTKSIGTQSDDVQVHALYDAWALTQNGTYTPASYFALAEALRQKTTLAVWVQMLDALEAVDRLEIGRPDRGKFHAYARWFLAPIFATVGWDAKPGEGENVSLLRTRLITDLGNFEDKAVIAESFKRYQAYLHSPDSLPANLQSTVFGIVGRYGDQSTFDELHKLALNAQTTEDKMMFYHALETARNPALAAQALQIALGSEMEPVQASFSAIYVAAYGEHPEMVWRFTEKNMSVLKTRMPGMFMGFYVEGLLSSFNGSGQANVAARYFSKNLPNTFQLLINKGLAINALMARLKVRLLPQVEKWLSTAAPGASTGNQPAGGREARR